MSTEKLTARAVDRALAGKEGAFEDTPERLRDASERAAEAGDIDMAKYFAVRYIAATIRHGVRHGR